MQGSVPEGEAVPRVLWVDTMIVGHLSLQQTALQSSRTLRETQREQPYGEVTGRRAPWGIEFVSFSEQLDTSTPAGKMVFTVLGAVAELERGLIVERVKAGLRNAKAKGKRLGRPRVIVDRSRIATLRKAGRSWSEISKETGFTKGTAQRAFYQ